MPLEGQHGAFLLRVAADRRVTRLRGLGYVYQGPQRGASGRVASNHAASLRTCVPLVTSQGRPYARFKRALKSRNAHQALAAAAELRQINLADALSLVFLIREDTPVLYDKAAVRWFAKYAADDRYLVLRDARELVDLLDGVGRHDQVAVVRLERWLRARGYDDEADRVA